LAAVHAANVLVGHEYWNDDNFPPPVMDMDFLDRLMLADRPPVWRDLIQGPDCIDGN
jgi:hypothetical protein